MNLDDLDLMVKGDGRGAEGGAERSRGARACCGNDEELRSRRTDDEAPTTVRSSIACNAAVSLG